MSFTALALDTAAARNPISVAEVKTHLRITGTDDDLYLTALIGAAVAYVDATGVLGRAMITQSWAQWVPQSPGWVRLAIGPVQSLTSVQYYDADGTLQTDTLGNFELWLDGDYHVCKPKTGFSWPSAQSRGDAIKIVYVTGFGDDDTDVPAGLRHALLMLVAHWYESREPVTDGQQYDTPLAFDALIGVQRVGWYG